MEEIKSLVAQFVCFQMHNKRLQLKSFNILVRNYLFFKNYITSEGAVSQHVLYYQQLSTARIPSKFMLTTILSNYEVSSALKKKAFDTSRKRASQPEVNNFTTALCWKHYYVSNTSSQVLSPSPSLFLQPSK